MSLIALLAASTPAEPPGPTVRNIGYDVRPQYGELGTTTTPQQGTFEVALMDDAEEVTLTYMASANREMTLIGNDLAYTATVDGQPVTFGGEPVGICLDGGTLTSDPITVDREAGETISVFTRIEGSGGDLIPRTTWPMRPFRVNAPTQKPSVLLIGSSTGASERFALGMQDAGVPVVNCSNGGTRAPQFTDQVLGSMLGLDDPHHGFTHAFLQIGINSNQRGIEEMAGGAIDLAWRLRERGVPHITQKVWKPHTSSTDGWSTVEGQAVRYPARQRAVAWLRRGAPVTLDGREWVEHGGAGTLLIGQQGHPFDMICDYSLPLQDTTEIDLFRVGHGPLSSDGIHITPTGYDLVRPTIQAWAESIA